MLGEAIEELNRVVQRSRAAPGLHLEFGGEADMMQESFFYLMFALFLAIIMIYMVLASQFESFMHPFTIMLSVPLSIIGAIGVAGR